MNAPTQTLKIAEAFEAPAFGERAGGDGGGGVHENHHVEKEDQHARRDGVAAEEKSAEAADSPVFAGDGEIKHVAQRRSAVEFEGMGSADEGSARAGGSAVDAAHHEGISANEEADHAERIDEKIHAHGVGDVLGAAHAGFDECEAGHHEHDEEPGQKRPDEIDGAAVLVEVQSGIGRGDRLLGDRGGCAGQQNQQPNERRRETWPGNHKGGSTYCRWADATSKPRRFNKSGRPSVRDGRPT